MDTTPVYLKHNAVLEPLYNQWYAWAYLIPPASAAMFTANTHVPLLQSFVESPEVHISALTNPAMRGGPFIDLPESRQGEVKDLLSRTLQGGAHMMALADAIKRLDQLLVEQAKGASLDELYAQIPEPLQGYVELVYDMQDRASVRYFERLLYKSPYFREDAQSLCMCVVNPDQRAFRLSTPRMCDPGELMLHVPFTSTKLDALYATRYEARPFAEICALMEIRPEDVATFEAFFTTTPPKARTPYDGDQVRLRYFGHACVLIEARGVSILVDPMVSYDVDGGPSRFSHADIPQSIDYVVISHNHQDHVLFETLLELRHRIKTVVVPRSKGDSIIDPSLKLIFERIGFQHVIELGEMETLDVPGGTIKAVPFLGEHGDLDIRTKMGIRVQLGERVVLMAVDSNNFEPALYEHVYAKTGDADVLFVGMECEGAPMTWLYGPLFTRPVLRKNDHSRRFDGSNCEKAMNLVDLFHPGQVFIYAMGMEPWLGHVAALHYTPESPPIVESNATVARCAERGIIGERLYLKKEVCL